MEQMAERAVMKVEKLKKLYLELLNNIEWILQRSAMYYNKTRLGGSRLREGDLVYLLRRNIRIIRLSDKLDHKKIGSFKVKRNIKNINFKFHILITIRIHPVFHISILEPADPDTLTGPAPEIHPNL
jgi:hypothetical protein